MSRAAVPSFVSEPQVRFLQAVLEEIRDGQIQVPRFQRPFVWTEEQQTELLRSIRDGLPVGAIMVWRTHITTIACYDRLGPYPLKPPVGAGGVRQYLLDGVQRMATLYGALFPSSGLTVPSNDVPGDADEWESLKVYVDLVTRNFEWMNEQEFQLSRPRAMPLEVVFDAVKLSRFLRTLPDHMTAEVEAAEQVARAFREYKIPVIPVVGDDLDIATRTFQRINSHGTPMSFEHMAHALSWSPDFDLLATIDELRARLLEPVGWDDIDEGWIVDACRLALDLHTFERDVEELSRRLRERPQVIEEAVRGIRLAAEFLRSECHVVSPDFVPYRLQAVFLADALRLSPTPAPNARRCLYSWLWLSTYVELFSGVSLRGAVNVVSDVRQMAADGLWRWRSEQPIEPPALPRRWDWRGPRAKALAVRLAELAQAAPGDEVPFRLLGARGWRAIRPLLLEGPARWRADPGNHFLVAPEDVAVLRESLEKLPDGPALQTLCRIHCVSESALALLRGGRHGNFIEQRRSDLEDLETRFFLAIATRPWAAPA